MLELSPTFPLSQAKKKIITRLIASALDAVNPRLLIKQAVQVNGNFLTIKDRSFNLPEFNRIIVVGAGKASIPMTQELYDLLGNRISSGYVLSKKTQLDYPGSMDTCHILLGSHPLPSANNIQNTSFILDQLSGSTKNDLILFALSGGGSALLTLPAPGIDIDDIRKITQLLLNSGASIHEINCIRKHIDLVKGGGFAQSLYPATLITLILSDVLGDPLDLIASGPTVNDPSTFIDAVNILNKYQLVDQIPESIQSYLMQGCVGNLPETPKPDSIIFENSTAHIIGNNYTAAHAAHTTACNLGIHSLLFSTHVQGEAKNIGIYAASMLKEIKYKSHMPTPCCVIMGGESTVLVKGSGLGGRNQEIALSAVPGVSLVKDVAIITISTDGEDGLTPAAGAIITGETYGHGIKLDLYPETFLRNNDSYHYFLPMNALVQTGPTYTNVNDLMFLFSF